MGRKSLEDNLDYKTLRDVWAVARATDHDFEERVRLEMTIHEESQRMRKAQAVVEAYRGGLTVNAIGRAVGRTAHREREKVIDWAFDFLNQKRVNTIDVGVEF